MSTALSDASGPLRAQIETRRSAIRPVSRVWFELSDKVAFDKCIELCLNWMEETPRDGVGPRSGVLLPTDAWKGSAFDVTDVLGANPAKAVRIDASDGALWAARLDWPDPQYARTWVSEFFAERRHGQLSRFGAQLNCVVRGDCPQFDITRPTVVRRVLELLSAEADGRQLADGVERTEKSEIADLVDFLYEPSRRLPVIAISETEFGTTQVAPGPLARQIAGAAHIVHLSNDASWELTRVIGKRISVFNGAVRLYLPGLTEENEDPYQHPLWLLQEGAGQAFIKGLAARVLPSAFLSASSQTDFPRYAYVREIVAKRALPQISADDPNETLRAEIELLRFEVKETEEERDSWESLAQEEQNKRISRDAEIERLNAEIFRLETKAATLEYHFENRNFDIHLKPPTDRTLISYDDLESWAEEVLGENVYIHDLALKDCRKNGHPNMLKRIETALLTIRDYVVPARLKGGLDLYEKAREKLTEIGMEDKACFVDRDEAKRTPGYSVQYERETRILNNHFKYGNGYDNANQLRIYYFWDEKRKRLVVGKMPSHLRNNMTT